MWLFVVFDLPVKSAAHKKEYYKFRKILLSCGFIAIQYSVYRRWVEEKAHLNTLVHKVRNELPSRGDVMILKIPPKTMNTSEYYKDEQLISPPIPPTPWIVL